MSEQTRPFDPAAYLGDREAQTAYMNEALESGDWNFVADALGVLARARGMSSVAKDAGLSRESLYRALSTNGNPELGTVLKVLRALDLKLTASPIPPQSRPVRA